MAGLVANLMVTAVLERSLQHSEILKSIKGAYRKRWKLGATKHFFTLVPLRVNSYWVLVVLGKVVRKGTLRLHA